MSLPNTSEKSVYLDREEHFHKGSVGGKIVVPYTYNAETDTLSPLAGDIQPTVNYDFIDVASTSANVDTLTLKNGGSGGSTVRTIVINYTGGQTEKVSDELDSVAFS